MPFTNLAINASLDALANTAPTANLVNYATLHTAYSATGANEVTGGSPAYARVALTWSAASSGSKALASAPSAINVPASTTVAFVGMTSAASAGLSGSNFAGMFANGGATIYGATITNASPGVVTAPGSSYGNGTAVVLWAGVGDTLPAAFTAGTIYYVVSASGATFSLSATSGGSAINTAGTGSCLVQAITLETFGAQGTFSITADTLSYL